MSQELTTLQSPEQAEIAAKQGEVERMQEVLAAVQEKIAALSHALARFEAEYTAAVAPYYLRLDRWLLRCEELRWSNEQLRAGHTDADAPSLNAEALPGARTERYRARWEELGRKASEYAPAEPPPPEPLSSPVEETELKRLYRQLAKRFHPDLASTPGTKAAREIKMAEINAAYQARNLAGLRAMVHDPDLLDEYAETPGEKLVRLIREIARLKRLQAKATASLRELRQSDLACLLRRVLAARAKGEDALALLTGAVQQEIDAAKAEWYRLRAEESTLLVERD